MVSSQHTHHDSKSHAAPTRVILLGASNLTRDFGLVLAMTRRWHGSPVEIFAALGHGRAYCVRSCFLGRTMPSIGHSGLWRALPRHDARPTVALVTDIGNDVMYGAPVKKIVNSVARCLRRLTASGAKTIATLPPVCNFPHLSRARFYLLRNVLFPTCRIDFDSVVARATDLEERLQELDGDILRWIKPVREWYGIDPIHLRRRCRAEAWEEILSGWPSRFTSPLDLSSAPHKSLGNLGLRPQRSWLCGIQQQRRQPVKRLLDGTTISLF